MPNDVALRYNLGLARKLKDDLPGAVVELRKAEQLDPQNADVHYTLGVTLWQQGEFAPAAEELQAAIKGDEALISKARTDLSYTHITAPIDGVTGLRTLDAGNVIHGQRARQLQRWTAMSIRFTSSKPGTCGLEKAETNLGQRR